MKTLKAIFSKLKKLKDELRSIPLPAAVEVPKTLDEETDDLIREW